MAKPRYKPTEEDRQRVRQWAGVGLTEAAMASILGISNNTLRLRFMHDLTFGRDIVQCEIVTMAFEAARNGSIPAIRMLDQKIAKAASKDDFERFGDEPLPTDKPKHEPKLGKKHSTALRARIAGENSEWGEDLRVPETLRFKQ